MKMMIATLELSKELDGHKRDRCPDVVFRAAGEVIAAIRTDETQPKLPLPDGSVTHIVLCDDALSRVIDEEAWLMELYRVIAMGGVLQLTLPAEGPLAWLDSMNVYRYITDISRRGQAPNAARPTGWNRHYRRKEVSVLVTSAGFTVAEIARQKLLLSETRMLTGLFWKNWVRGEKDAEQALFNQHGRRDPRENTTFTGSTWAISVRKP